MIKLASGGVSMKGSHILIPATPMVLLLSLVPCEAWEMLICK